MSYGHSLAELLQDHPRALRDGGNLLTLNEKELLVIKYRNEGLSLRKTAEKIPSALAGRSPVTSMEPDRRGGNRKVTRVFGSHITTERVRQIEAKAIRKIRGQIKRKQEDEE